MIEHPFKSSIQKTEPFPDFAQAFDAVVAQLRHVLICAPLLVRTYTEHLAKSHGKMIRAASVLACSQQEDCSIPADAVAMAVAVELLHLATLVHDDVVDNADLRRGLPTLQKKFGKRVAVICGDYLLASALRMAYYLSNRERYLSIDLPDYIGRICMGELRQETNCRNLDLSISAYLRIINGKTAALFEASYLLGALANDRVDVAAQKRYARLGRYIGMIFQLTDDCIDFELEEEVAKKPVRSDYEQGVVTLPLIHVLKQDPTFKQLLQAGRLSRFQLDQKVRECGGLSFTHWISSRYYAKAQRLIEALSLFEEKRQRLSGILDKAYYGLKKDSKLRALSKEEAI